MLSGSIVAKCVINLLVVTGQLHDKAGGCGLRARHARRTPSSDRHPYSYLPSIDDQWKEGRVAINGYFFIYLFFF